MQFFFKDIQHKFKLIISIQSFIFKNSPFFIVCRNCIINRVFLNFKVDKVSIICIPCFQPEARTVHANYGEEKDWFH